MLLTTAMLLLLATSPNPKALEWAKKLGAVDRWEGEFTCPYSFEWKGQHTFTVGPNKTPVDGEFRYQRRAQGTFVLERSREHDGLAWVGKKVQVSGAVHDYESSVPRGGTRSEHQDDAEELVVEEVDPSAENPSGAFLRIDPVAGTWTFECPYIQLKGQRQSTYTSPRQKPVGRTQERTYYLQVCKIENVPLESDRGLGGTFRMRADVTPVMIPVAPPELACTVTLKPLGQKKTVTAKLEAAPVPRGELQTLSAESSEPKGKLKSYRWKFRGGECPEGVQPTTVTKEGPKVQVRLLCPTFVELTVSDGKEEDTVVSKVAPARRPWKTKFTHHPEEKLLPAQALTKPIRDPSDDRGIVNGANLCGASDSGKECEHLSHSLHPGPGRGKFRLTSWRDRGYRLTQLTDPGGPYDGAWYVQESKLEVTRRTWMNPYILPTSKPLGSATINFYEANRKYGRDVDGFLAAVRGHEGMEAVSQKGERVAGHSGRMRDWLQEEDPAEELEQLAATDEKSAEERADQVVEEAEIRLCEASGDPLNPVQWEGELLGVCAGTGYYVPLGELAVGGPNYGGTKDCRCSVRGDCPPPAPPEEAPKDQSTAKKKTCPELAAEAGLPTTP